jgi:hypothetical protein
VPRGAAPGARRAGGAATVAGRFLVENRLDEPISAVVCVSPFTSVHGHTVVLVRCLEPAAAIRDIPIA